MALLTQTALAFQAHWRQVGLFFIALQLEPPNAAIFPELPFGF
jgi:hypothetical protein